MAQVPYPISADNVEALRSQVYELIRKVYEDRIGGLSLGDVFEDSGDVLTLSTGTSLAKTSGTLDVSLNATGGLQSTATGLSVKPKTAGGLATDANGLYISGAAYGFGGVHPSSGDDFSADAIGDTLNLTAGVGIVATGVAATDTVTIAVKQQAHIADAETSHAVTDWATTNTALNNLGIKINAILAALETAEILSAS